MAEFLTMDEAEDKFGTKVELMPHLLLVLLELL